jgi:pyruvate dehydrogenase E1 component
LTTLGTDGFGRSETRANLRRFFEIDAESTVIATLHALAQRGAITPDIVAQAIRDLNVDPEKNFPKIAAF